MAFSQILLSELEITISPLVQYITVQYWVFKNKLKQKKLHFRHSISDFLYFQFLCRVGSMEERGKKTPK